MTDLFAPNLPASVLQDKAFRLVPVDGDGMEPRLKGGRDYVMIKPLHSYVGEGTYVFYDGPATLIYNVVSVFGSRQAQLRLRYENGRYQEHIVPREWFDQHVLGIVVADLKVRDERFLREAVESGGN